jgi:sulfide:quinone oxidoreductase
MLRRRAEQLQLEPKIVVLTPESTPLSIFGEDASAAVAGRLAARHVEVEPDVQVGESGGELLRDDGSPVAAGAAIALPRIDGPSIPGLPSERDGFVPIDEHCRVIGCDDVYAAGDGTSFPIKQGGIASQQADAAAEHLAYTMGVRIEPQPFRPVLRGELLTGADSIKMLHTINDGEEGLVSPDYLWWPRLKVGGRYLSAWLAGTAPRSDLQPREMPIEVEASWPHDWHGEPI